MKKPESTDPPMPPPRFSTRRFPVYAYVPGMHPHPFSDPRGHSWDAVARAVDPADRVSIRNRHLWAVDLFNHGYVWEAHEAWESLWIAAGRVGPAATFLKGLIKLAAAGVKARQGKLVGVRRHARRAAELFLEAADDRGFSCELQFGLSCQLMRQNSMNVLDAAASIVDRAPQPVVRVLPVVLQPIFPSDDAESPPPAADEPS
ncbi:hypothetical protein EC9_42400 [Rosistilla ulvae]|uniref:DUF309 domain-containing protein n=1 Tax=Rosistilla ulvae TaxID=1930277 RepID=A0A517M589_9BACT|nr:DUF309 domain-containing protein [Rosistilla ulvae]QDS90037.1 hypothetical protein EC9_42400 [Rosistilla ulvae]